MFYLVKAATETETLSEKTDKVRASTENLNNSLKISDDILKGYNDLKQSISETANEIDNLNNKSDKTKEDNDKIAFLVNKNENAHKNLQNVMREIADKTTPDVITEFDKLGNVISINTDKVDQFTKKQKEANKQILTRDLADLEKKLKEERKLYEEQEKIILTRKKPSQKTEGSSYAPVTITTEVTLTDEELKKEDLRFKELQNNLSETANAADLARKALAGIREETKKPKDLSQWQQSLQDYINSINGFKYEIDVDKGQADILSDLTTQYKNAEDALKNMEASYAVIGGYTKNRLTTKNYL